MKLSWKNRARKLKVPLRELQENDYFEGAYIDVKVMM
jgi:hypothetical protein